MGIAPGRDGRERHRTAHFSTANATGWSSGSTYVIGDVVASGGHDFSSKQNSNTNHLPTVGGDAFWTDLGVVHNFGAGEVRIVKINVHTGAIMWSNVVNVSLSVFQMVNQSRIRHGRYNWLDNSGSTAHMHSMNTLTGVDSVSAALNQVSPNGKQVSDDVTGNVYIDTDFLFSASPVQIGTTPSSFSSWATFGPAAGPAIPAAIPPSDGVNWLVPVAIGFTFTSQGQILRPINPAGGWRGQRPGARQDPPDPYVRRAAPEDAGHQVRHGLLAPPPGAAHHDGSLALAADELVFGRAMG